MTVLTVRSEHNDLLQPLLASAVAAKLQVLAMALRQSERRLASFEREYQLSTHDFVARYARNEIAETLDKIEWLGEYRLAAEYPG